MEAEKVKPDEVYAFICDALRSGLNAKCIREEVNSALRHGSILENEWIPQSGDND